MEVPRNPKRQGYLPLQEQITNTSEQDFSPQEEHTPQEGYENAPPPYYPPVQQQPCLPDAQAVPVIQQQTSNIIVVQSQPTLVVARSVFRRTSDHYLTLSIALTLICFFIGNCFSLLCTIPAIVFAISAHHAKIRGNLQEAQFKARVALILNIISIMFGVVVVIIVMVASVSVPIAVTAGDTGYYSYYNNYYCYYSTRYRSAFYTYYTYTDYSYTYPYAHYKYYITTTSNYTCYK